MPTANINGIQMYYERHGDDGEPLVLVHGYTGDVTDWRHQVPEFSRTHRVLLMDHRGHGRSECPVDRDSYTILAMADDVEALAADAGFERYHLVGHSMGGAVAQEIALRSPGRLMSLTLHDTSWNFVLSRTSTVAAWMEQRRKLADEQGMAAIVDGMKSPIPPPPHMPAERIDESNERLKRMSVDGFIGAWNALDRWAGTQDRIAGVTVPTMVIFGDMDYGLIDAAKGMAAAIPGAVVEVIPEAGHSPQYERPELFNAALRRHLANNAGSSAK
jgi:pimeloyl-ACP methyl ester carboxylesterase